MVRTPSGSKKDLNRGAWTAEEDMVLTNYVKIHGESGWRSLPKKAGLNRCGKSCRLRWLNYLRPDIKRGNISSDEEELIIRMHRLLGNRWSLIAGRLPGRTDNEIKNYWNTHLGKKLARSSTGSKLQNQATSKQRKDQTSSSEAASTIRSALYEQVSSLPLSEGMKSNEELDVFPSWTQFFEDSLMKGIAEETSIGLNNDFLFGQSYSQIGLGNDSGSSSSSDLGMPELESISSPPLNVINSCTLDFNSFSLPCIDLGSDLSVEDLLQHAASVSGDISPIPRCDDVDDGKCVAMEAGQGIAEQCTMNGVQQWRQLDLCDVLDYKEHWEDQLVNCLIQEKYEDIFIDICN